MPSESIICDQTVYGFFPEFRRYLSSKSVSAGLARLASLDRTFVEQCVNSVPREWELGRAAGVHLVDFICRRATIVVDFLEDRLIDNPMLPRFEDE
jgi:hypothetical protein